MSEISKVIQELKSKTKNRKFVQSMDLAINVKGIDLKKPENRFKEEIILPKSRGEPAKICVIGSELSSKAKNSADVIIPEDELGKYEKDKKTAKKLIKTVDFFLAEPQLMARIGKSLGRFMGPLGKMPKPFPPQADPTTVISKLKDTVIVKLTDKTPVIHCMIGNEKMTDEDIEKNATTIINAVKNKLPSHEYNIRSVYLKFTMGPAQKIEKV